MTVTPSLPIVDFSAWTSEGAPSGRLASANELVKACHETGFVYIINHGVSPQTLDEAFAWTKKFFDLTYEKKMEAKKPEESIAFRGYIRQGVQKAVQVLDGDKDVIQTLRAVPDFNENYNYGSDENKEQPNIWPPESTLPGFKDFATKFYWECWQTANLILRALAIVLGLDDEEFFLKYHDGHSNQIALRNYMPIAAAEIESGQKERLGTHSDFGMVTLLFQDDCGGLEVETPGELGKFIPATPIKNALVMNVGDLLQYWSNDYLKSTLHRVRLPPLQDRYSGKTRMTRQRYSVPYFVAPDSDAIVECIPTCCDERTPAKYAPLSWAEWLHMRSSTAFGTE